MCLGAYSAQRVYACVVCSSGRAGSLQRFRMARDIFRVRTRTCYWLLCTLLTRIPPPQVSVCASSPRSTRPPSEQPGNRTAPTSLATTLTPNSASRSAARNYPRSAHLVTNSARKQRPLLAGCSTTCEQFDLDGDSATHGLCTPSTTRESRARHMKS